jgi:ribose 5-phosphate isomerase B
MGPARTREMPSQSIAIAADHAGFELKSALKDELASMGFSVLDLGTDGPDSVDYPDFARAVVAAMQQGRATRGLLICGSGIGMSIAANRHAGIRAALCYNAEAARLARLHNDANVLVLGARMIDESVAKECADVFFTTEFEAGRHARRVAKLS